jgi:hypothetical protein
MQNLKRSRSGYVRRARSAELDAQGNASGENTQIVEIVMRKEVSVWPAHVGWELEVSTSFGICSHHLIVSTLQQWFPCGPLLA